jgi:hypothetical protein
MDGPVFFFGCWRSVGVCGAGRATPRRSTFTSCGLSAYAERVGRARQTLSQYQQGASVLVKLSE